MFGLAAAGGVVRHLEEHGAGFTIGGVRVPIVVGAVIFDLLVGDQRARPTAESGYAACAAATVDPAVGRVGAGTGATVAKAGDPRQARPGGVGLASAAAGAATVAALAVVNSVGGIWDDEAHQWVAPLVGREPASGRLAGASTTLGVVITDARLTVEEANRVAAVAQDGIARAVRPAHTRYDGDAIVCLATGEVEAPRDAVEVVAADVLARAVVTGARVGRSGAPSVE